MSALFSTIIFFFLTFSSHSAQAAEQPKTFKVEVEQLGYAAAHFNHSWESRTHLELLHHSKPKASLHDGISWGISLDLWGIVPQQVSDWFDIREAFIDFNVSNLELKTGRILPEWAKNDRGGPFQEIFSKFTIDPLTDFTDGIVGIYAVYPDPSLRRDDPWLFEFLYSPLFIPNRGGINFEKNAEGLPSPSRWLPPLFEKVKIGEALIPVGYTLHLPALSDVLLKQGGLIRISFNTTGLNIALIAARFFKPEAELRHDARLHIQNETSVEAKVHLYPEFPEERLWGVQSGLKLAGIDFFNEAGYFDRESTFINRAGFEIKTNQRWFPSFMTAIQFSKNFQISNIQSQTDSFIPARSSDTWMSIVTLRPLEMSQLFLSYETDFLMTQRILRGGINLEPFSQMTFGIGFDMLSGDDKTYWGMFRSNDRLWVKASYAF